MEIIMHEIDMSNGRANMAYVGETPWHKLGHPITEGASFEQWGEQSGLLFEIKKAKMLMEIDGEITGVTDALNRSVLYRTDTHAPLSIMSTDQYEIHQPRDILKFIFDAAEAMGYKMHTAGSLKGGRKIWALARIPEAVESIGKGDEVRGFLLAATSCDGSMASEFLFTTVRVVCANTLHMAVNDDSNTKPRVKVLHMESLNLEAVKKGLGIAPTMWARFIENAKRLAKVKLTEKKAVDILRKVYAPKPVEADGRVIEAEFVTDQQYLEQSTNARQVLDLYQGKGRGALLTSAKDTAWGLVNAVTQHVDFGGHKRQDELRLNSMWFGTGAHTKERVLEACLELVD
jgi:phage/plasmid-like protein (TIGR03299 family)